MKMNKESWIINLKLSLVEMKLWKRSYIQKQLAKNPNVSREELSRKIKNARKNKFKEDDYLIFEHPDFPYSQ